MSGILDLGFRSQLVASQAIKELPTLLEEVAAESGLTKRMFDLNLYHDRLPEDSTLKKQLADKIVEYNSILGFQIINGKVQPHITPANVSPLYAYLAKKKEALDKIPYLSQRQKSATIAKLALDHLDQELLEVEARYPDSVDQVFLGRADPAGKAELDISNALAGKKNDKYKKYKAFYKANKPPKQ